VTRLRVVTLNFWGIEPPLHRRLALAERQLAALAPDAIGVQEVRPLDGQAGTTTAAHLADRLGMHHVYEVATRWGGGQEGLAILSRHPILEHRALPLPEARPTEARILLSARLDTGAGPIWVHTTHLHYRLDDGVARERQVAALDAAIRALGREPSDPPQILCGDFNSTDDSDEMRFLRGLHTLDGRRTHWQDAWLRLHPTERGITWSSENEQTRPLRSLDIDRRIDYVLVTSRKKDGRGTIERCEVVLTDRDGDICASDHYGVLAEVRIG
jgi:endonuclease/exonuclease/phosphatase family metal-dependent hydrolase